MYIYVLSRNIALVIILAARGLEFPKTLAQGVPEENERYEAVPFQ